MLKKLCGIFAVMVIAAVLCVGLSACGGGQKAEHYDGKYAEIVGSYMPISEVYDSGDNYIELKDSENIVICLGGDEMVGTYKIDGEKISVTLADGSYTYDMDGTIKDGIIELDFMQMSTLVFAQDGVDLSKYTSGESES